MRADRPELHSARLAAVGGDGLATGRTKLRRSHRERPPGGISAASIPPVATGDERGRPERGREPAQSPATGRVRPFPSGTSLVPAGQFFTRRAVPAGLGVGDPERTTVLDVLDDCRTNRSGDLSRRREEPRNGPGERERPLRRRKGVQRRRQITRNSIPGLAGLG